MPVKSLCTVWLQSCALEWWSEIHVLSEADPVVSMVLDAMAAAMLGPGKHSLGAMPARCHDAHVALLISNRPYTAACS